jgi:hypothetical protein
MKVYVTAIDQHPVEGHPGDFRDSALVGVGQHVVVSSHGVIVDGVWVLRKDRRAKKNRQAGHPWLTEVGGNYKHWTTFAVNVDPDR